MAGMSVRSSLWNLPAPTRGNRCGLEAGNARWPFQYFPSRTCGTLRKLYPGVGCWLSATGGTVRRTGHCWLFWTQSTVRQYTAKREQKGLCIKKNYACKTYTSQGHAVCPATPLFVHSKY